MSYFYDLLCKKDAKDPELIIQRNSALFLHDFSGFSSQKIAQETALTSRPGDFQNDPLTNCHASGSNKSKITSADPVKVKLNCRACSVNCRDSLTSVTSLG